MRRSPNCQRFPNDFPMSFSAFLTDCSNFLNWSASTALTAPQKRQVILGFCLSRRSVSENFLPQPEQGMSTDSLSKLMVMRAPLCGG